MKANAAERQIGMKMAIEDMRIYVIESGPARTAWDDYQAAIKEEKRRTRALSKRLGASTTTHWASRRKLHGFIFSDDSKVPGIKKKPDGPGKWIGTPDRRLKAGKEIDREMAEIDKIAPERDVMKKLFRGSTEHFGASDRGMVFYSGSLGTIENTDTPAACVHKKCKAKPIDGMREIPLSEYYQLQGK